MEKGLAAKLLRVFLAFAIGYAPILHAAEQYNPPPTQTDGGGGGKIPPETKVKLGGGGDMDDGRGKNRKGGGDSEEVKTGEFGQRWGIESGKPSVEAMPQYVEGAGTPNLGAEVYYEGTTDGKGNIRVWKYDTESGIGWVRRGIVEKATGTDGVVRWQSFDTWTNLWRQRSGFTGFNRGNQEGKAGELYGHDVNAKEIFYEGWRDYAGRLVVRQYTDGSHYMFRRGYVQKVPGSEKLKGWNGSSSARKTAPTETVSQVRITPNSNYAGTKVTDQIPSNRALVKVDSEPAKDLTGRSGSAEVNSAYKESARAPEFREVKPSVEAPKSSFFSSWFGTSTPPAPETAANFDGYYVTRWEKGYFRQIGSKSIGMDISGNLLESIKVKNGVNAKGEPILETVYFQGRRSEQGYERVFRPDTSQGSVNADLMRTGQLMPDGSVQWDERPISRGQLVRELSELDLNKSRLDSDQRARFNEQLKLLKTVAGKDITEKLVRITPNSNYAGQTGTSPLPANRALVPFKDADGNIPPSKDLSGRSGQAEVSSPYRESFSRANFEPLDAPSKMGSKLEWSRAKGQELQSQLRDWMQGNQERMDEWRESLANKPGRSDAGNMNERAARLSGGATADVSSTAFYFYAALGIAAAYTLANDYSSNPAAWTSYMDSLKDPVGYASLGAFMIAAAPFYRMLGKASVEGKPLKEVPLATAMLLAGSLAASAVSKLARDKDFQKCEGFTTFPERGLFIRDYAACDRLYEKWFSDDGLRDRLADIANDFMPTAVNMSLTGLVFFGGQAAAGKALGSLMSKLATASPAVAARTVTIIKNPVFLIGFGVARFAGFMGIYRLFDQAITQPMEDWQILSFNLNGNDMLPLIWLLPGRGEYVRGKWLDKAMDNGPAPAETTAQAETQLLNEWARIKRNDWKNPYIWKNVCFNEHRAYQKFYNCDAPDVMDFENVLDTYHKFQETWRSHKMQPTTDAYKEWMKKLNDYQNSVDSAHTFYATAIKRIKAGAFTQDRLNLTMYGRPSGSDTPWSVDYSGIWKYVDTPKQQDFLLASMACGPEVEGYGGSNGFWGSASSLFKHWVTGNYSPEGLVKNPTGRQVQFYPPMVTVPMDKTNVCEITGRPGLPNPIELIGPTMRDAPGRMLIAPGGFTGMFTGNSKTYRSLLDYVRDNIRPSVLENFEPWWKENVQKETDKLMPVLRADYQQMLEKTYKPALIRHDYVSGWCGPAVNNKTGLEQYYKMLPAGEGKCPGDAIHRQAYGILDSMHDEMRLYLAMLIDLYSANYVAKGGADQAAVIAKSKALLETFEAMLKEMEVLNGKDRHAKEAFEKGKAAWNELAQLIATADDEPIKTINTIEMENGVFQRRWANALMLKAHDLFKNYQTHYNALSTFEN